MSWEFRTGFEDDWHTVEFVDGYATRRDLAMPSLPVASPGRARPCAARRSRVAVTRSARSRLSSAARLISEADGPWYYRYACSHETAIRVVENGEVALEHDRHGGFV
jgi:hypothetical protein